MKLHLVWMNSKVRCKSIPRNISRSSRKYCFAPPTIALRLSETQVKKELSRSEFERRKQERVKREDSKKVGNVPQEKDSKYSQNNE